MTEHKSVPAGADAPEWAKRLFCQRANLAYDDVLAMQGEQGVVLRSAVRAGGLIIHVHEYQPSAMLIEAREIVIATLKTESHKGCFCRAEIAAGKWDDGQKIKATLAALRRGIELAGDRP